MRVLVTGSKGQLAFDVINILNMRGIDCRGVDLDDFDITNLSATSGYICEYMPNAVIHCAAYTDVERAEKDIILCRAVNVDGTKNIAVACKNIKSKMLFISTDYVFPGNGDQPYETDDPTGAINVYGQSKADGELEVINNLSDYFIVRTSWAFGINSHNFVTTMLRLGKERDELNVVCDQIGSPTYTADLAPLLCDMILTDKHGTYHATNEGYCSWADFAEEIFKLAGNSTKVKKVLSSEYPTKAQRPPNSRLSKKSLDKASFTRLPSWKDAIERYLRCL